MFYWIYLLLSIRATFRWCDRWWIRPNGDSFDSLDFHKHVMEQLFWNFLFRFWFRYAQRGKCNFLWILVVNFLSMTTLQSWVSTSHVLTNFGGNQQRVPWRNCATVGGSDCNFHIWTLNLGKLFNFSFQTFLFAHSY